MALDFPTSPALNQVYTFGSYSWRWDGTSWVGAVPIVNATINNTTIGAVTPSTGAFTSLTSTSGAFNGTVGATTPSTVAATTLTTSSTVTHNGGTANGVAFLDASKALTTGSALTFNGTSLGIGSSDYGNAATIAAAIGVPATTTGGLQLWSPTTGVHWVQFGDGTAGDGPYRGAVGYDHTVDALRLYAASVEVGRFTSTGLNNTAIGATTPSTVAATTLSASSSYTQASGVATLKYQAGDGSGLRIFQDASDVSRIYNNYAGSLVLGVSNTAVATFTSTGLNSTAIGATTPSTGVFTNVRIGSATSDELLTINGSSAGFVSRITSAAASNPNGFYYNSTNAIGTGTAFRVDSQGVSLLTLNSTGLAVTGALSSTGIISQTPNAGDPTYKLELVSAYSGTDSFRLKFAGNTQLRINTDDGVLRAPSGFGFAVTGALSATGLVSGSSGFAAGAALTGDNAITPLAAGMVLSGTNRAGLVTYTSVGNGTTIGLINNYANSSDSFKRYVDIVSFGSTGGAGGNIRLLVGDGSGATPQVANFTSTGLAVTGQISLTANNLLISGSGAIVKFAGESASFAAVRNDGSAQLGIVKADQSAYTVINASAFTVISDRRFKIDVENFSGSGPIIDALRPVRYNEDATKPMHKEGRKGLVGYLAQEVYEVFPQAVSRGDDGDEIVKSWGVDYAQVGSPIVIAELQSLRARVAALESK